MNHIRLQRDKSTKATSSIDIRTGQVHMKNNKLQKKQMSTINIHTNYMNITQTN